jgi:3-isopropylmalate dehydrogenase
MHKIGVLGGDGIGPELIAQGLRVLERTAELDGFDYELSHFPNSGRHYARTGVIIDPGTVAKIGELDALYFGAVGDPDLPEGTMERGLLHRLVDDLDLGVGVRPGTLYAEHLTPLKDCGPGDVDMVIVRDTSEDAFVAPGGVVRKGTPNEISLGLLVYTRLAVERVVRHAFQMALRRRRHVTVVSQSNAIASHEIWPRVTREVAVEFPDVTVRELYPDAAAMVMVTAPREIDVLLTTFWFGGIYSDLLGGLIGGIGLLGSARLNLERKLGLFEPAHGSAPKYTGTDKASPMGALRALAMLLEHVGEDRSARRIEGAIADVLATGRVPGVTARSGIGTVAATDEVLRALPDINVDAAVGTAG